VIAGANFDPEPNQLQEIIATVNLFATARDWIVKHQDLKIWITGPKAELEAYLSDFSSLD